ncbi:MAG TPA: dienelactone hydrolase family protein [Burkholderiales bacterium]|nr:dienelactone hydrolase family protein [Burkholderiales bacterium]
MFCRTRIRCIRPDARGYGVSGGPDVEDTGFCNQRDYPRGFEAAAAQTMAVLRYARTQSYIDSARGLLVGQSFGGATTVALAAKNIDGVKGAINFAGGLGGNPTGRPENPCSEHRLAQTYADYGRAAKTPMLWLYSENDRYWGKDLPRNWFEGFKKQGGDAQFVQLPASGHDGHSSFTANTGVWRPHVEHFLKSLGFVD